MKPLISLKITMLLTCLMLLSGCAQEELHTIENFKLYTLCQITTYETLKSSVATEIWDALDRIDATMSMHLKNSEISQINSAAGTHSVVVSKETFNVIKKALDYSDISSGFDISIGPLVTLWGIGSDSPSVPRALELQEALNLVDYKKVVLDEKKLSVYLPEPGMQLDLGAIAKGYAADVTRDILLEHGVKQAIINYGGNILTLGEKSKKKPWQIGVQNPDQARGAYIGVVGLNNQSIVTSGTYERFFEADGKRYHHLINTNDGYPIENGLWSVSIISQNSIDGDALSTLIFSQGLEKGLALIESLDQVDAIFVTNESKIYLSSGLKDNFKLVDETYTVMP